MIYVAPGDPGQTVFILFEEPESSTLAKLLSIYMQVRACHGYSCGCNASRLIKFALRGTQLLIFISSVIFITESLPSIRADKQLLVDFHVSCNHKQELRTHACIKVVAVQVAEWICILHFTLDYCMRIATCTRRPSHDKTLWGYAKQVRPLQMMPAGERSAC